MVVHQDDLIPLLLETTPLTPGMSNSFRTPLLYVDDTLQILFFCLLQEATTVDTLQVEVWKGRSQLPVLSLSPFGFTHYTWSCLVISLFCLHKAKSFEPLATLFHLHLLSQIIYISPKNLQTWTAWFSSSNINFSRREPNQRVCSVWIQGNCWWT